VLYFSWNWTKGGSTIVLTLMLLIRIVWSFVWRKFSSVGKGEWWDEVWTKYQAWGCPCHPNKYPRSTSIKAWGCPEAPPSSLTNIRSLFKTLYFYCFVFYAFFLERQLFLLSVLFYFVFCNKWLDHMMFVLERDLIRFHCQEHSSFHSYRSMSILFF
jgi:hypothetical protein